MICPYDCSSCHDVECRAEGCRMTGESVEMGLMPCEDCGTLIVLHIERVNCGPCLVITVTGGEEEI